MSTETEHPTITFWKDLEREAKACGAKAAAMHCKERIANAKRAIEAHERARERFEETKVANKRARAAETRAGKAHFAGTLDPAEAQRLRDELDTARSALRVTQAAFNKAAISWQNAESALHAARQCRELDEEWDTVLQGVVRPFGHGETDRWISVRRRYDAENPPPPITVRMWWPICEARAMALYSESFEKRDGKVNMGSHPRRPEELQALLLQRSAAADRWWDARRQQLAAEAALAQAEVGR